jgi:integrase
MNNRPRGRPKGSSGSAIPLSSDQIKRVLKVARSERYADRAELLLSLSIQLGMRATELASLKWIDIYDSNGIVRPVIVAKRAFLPSKRSQFDISSHPNLQKLLLSSMRSIDIPCCSMEKRRCFHLNMDP